MRVSRLTTGSGSRLRSREASISRTVAPYGTCMRESITPLFPSASAAIAAASEFVYQKVSNIRIQTDLRTSEIQNSCQNIRAQGGPTLFQNKSQNTLVRADPTLPNSLDTPEAEQVQHSRTGLKTPELEQVIRPNLLLLSGLEILRVPEHYTSQYPVPAIQDRKEELAVDTRRRCPVNKKTEKLEENKRYNPEPEVQVYGGWLRHQAGPLPRHQPPPSSSRTQKLEVKRSAPQPSNNHQIDYHITIPTGSPKQSHRRSQSLELKIVDENLRSRGSELAHSVSLLYQKFDKVKMCDVLEFDYVRESLQPQKPKAAPSIETGGNIEHEVDDTKFSVSERGLERSLMGQVTLERHASQRINSSLIEIIDVAEIFDWEETPLDEKINCDTELGSDDHDKIDDTKHKQNSMSIKEPSDEELNLVSYDMMASRSAGPVSSQDVNKCYEQEKSEIQESHSLDDVAESIENDFLNMLCQKQEDYLPREDDSLDADVMAEPEFFCRIPNDYQRLPRAEDFSLSSAILADEQNFGSTTHSMSKQNAKLIENLETEALMREWGLNEKDFQNSPSSSSGGFGSPVYVPTAESLKLPSLQECFGSIIQITGGGFLRSMNPLLFRNANNGARLIVQVSAPVVFPRAMGLTVMETLQCWASVGVEKMSIQANKLMPLEDISGKTIQQVMSEAESMPEAFKRYRSGVDEIDSDFVSFENLVPVAITYFEGLLIEGLRIQSGLPDQELPPKVAIQSVGISAPEANEVRVNFGSEWTSGLGVLDVDGLVKYALSLKDWMRLDTQGFDTDNGTDENGLKLRSAHCTSSLELSSGRNHGTLNKHFIMGLKVQLRDPLRDNEMVGSSMLVMIEGERIPSSKFPSTSSKNLNDEEDGLDKRLVGEIVGSEQKRWILEKGIPQFKFSQVHVTGLNTSLGKELWGTKKQQQSGSRWLLSSGLGRMNKNHISKSKAVVQSSSTIMRMLRPADVLWSISSQTQGEAATWDDIVGLNVHIRNPDIIFP
ncbi:hypothetical protein F511_15681 [Dorcoceras hygrometricum]|uniref:PMI1/PMIR1-2 C-terminal domain-containing protein n=1 Tax=Dorcoceras hygrometricum TaxID=472368 RepID=A0A2Z7BWD9_9LAMI|nr:hypothetical protein F511_15681 [Dorcoceras hygrometricum]